MKNIDNWTAILGAIIGGIMTFLDPVKWFMGFTAMLCIFDFVTGVRAAAAKGIKITSKGFYRSVEKIMVYFIAIITAEGMRVLFIEQMPFPYMVAGIISLTETKSIFENVKVITGTDLGEMITRKIEELIKNRR